MKLNICKKDFLEGLNKVGKAITGKTTIDSLKGVLIKAEKKGIALKGTDNDISIATLIPADVIEPGIVLIDYKLLLEVVRKLPNDDIYIELVDNEVKITCRKSQFSIIQMDRASYPTDPDIKIDKPIKIQQNDFKDLVNKVCYAAAEDNTRPILQGVFIELINKYINLVALDGYRLSLAKSNLDIETNINVVAQSKHLIEISKILDSNELNIFFTANHIIFKSDRTVIMSRLLEGKYPDYNSLVDDDTNKRIVVNRNNLMDAIERAMLLSNNEGLNRIVKLSITTNEINILSKSTKGNSTESIDLISVEGILEDFIIAFNSRYLLDALKHIDDEDVALNFTTSLKPCIIRGNNTNKDFETTLILPVRL